MKRYLPLAIVLPGLLFVLAACGGAGAVSNKINVIITDFAFSPVSFTVRAGDQISFNAQNNGSHTHDFVIMKLGKDVTAHFTDADMPNIFWGKQNIAPGAAATDSFTAPAEPGNYQIICAFSGHFEAGMVARLVVMK